MKDLKRSTDKASAIMWQELRTLENFSATVDTIADNMREELMPRIVATKEIHGYRVSVVEPTMLHRDGSVTRGYLWTAVIEPVGLTAAYMSYDGMSVPGKYVGGEMVSHSTKSVEAVLNNARRILKKRGAKVTEEIQPEIVREIPHIKAEPVTAPEEAPMLEQYSKVVRRDGGVAGVVLEIGQRDGIVWAAVAFGEVLEWVRAQDLKLR